MNQAAHCNAMIAVQCNDCVKFQCKSSDCGAVTCGVRNVVWSLDDGLSLLSHRKNYRRVCVRLDVNIAFAWFPEAITQIRSRRPLQLFVARSEVGHSSSCCWPAPASSSVLAVVLVVSSSTISVSEFEPPKSTQFDKTQLDTEADGGVDVRRAQCVLAQQLGRHEALHDVVAATAEPSRTTLRCRQRDEHVRIQHLRRSRIAARRSFTGVVGRHGGPRRLVIHRPP